MALVPLIYFPSPLPRKALASFTFPVLMIHGEKDYRTSEKEFVNANPKVYTVTINNVINSLQYIQMRLVVVEKADHLVMVAEGVNKKLADEIVAFIDDITASNYQVL